jgi:polyisoprenoid-binding protein YceI
MKHLSAFSALLVALAFTAQAHAADTYKIDPVHSSVLFRAKHVNTGYVWGRFRDVSGTFVLDDTDLSKSSFNVEIPVASIDSNNEKRDAHLKSPDFFNAVQYPTVSFRSTSVKKGEGATYDITGDLTLHGVTKPITLKVNLVGTGEFPPGSHRAGLDVHFSVKLSDYQIKGLPGAVDDEIHLIVETEGVKQ